MRRIFLIAALVLASASAQAAGPRSLSLASTNEPAAAQPTTTNTTVAQSTDATAKPAETPAYVERPSAVSTPAPAATTTNSAPAATQTQAATTATQPATQTPTKTTAKASKPKHKTTWTEGRIISELHRHGIYW